jgi:hypothetical protein
MVIAWLFFVISFLVFPLSTSYAQDNKYLNDIVYRALERKMYEERKWHVLLHYKPSIAYGFKSLIDDPDFFIAPDGKYNPESELIATIKALFTSNVKDDEHPRCRFVARYKWLIEKLDIDEDRLPVQECKKFNLYMEMLNPKSAVLVFPASHINSPASMFGHTLLRLDSHYESKLMSYAINYSAFVDRERLDLFYAFKGIFGFYKGYFAIMPYYEKIAEYGHIENRNIWEYHLNLSEEEVKDMTMHLWELQNIYSNYYFFDENCSYMLLFLIEAARPDVYLTDSFLYWVIPVDTIRIIKEQGLIYKTVYRPAKATKIKHIAQSTDSLYQNLSKRLAEGKITTDDILRKEHIKNSDKIKTIDLSVEYLQYLYAKKKIDKNDYSKRFLDILSARSTLGTYEYTIPAPPQPEEGHRTSRVAIGTGIKNDNLYQNIQFRFVYHDMLDPDEGYISNSAISFLDTDIRYDYSDNKVFLQKFILLKINSLAERDRFFKSIAWKISTGVNREEISKEDDITVYNVNGGAGISKKIFSNGLVYGLLVSDINVGGELDKNYAVGGGLSAGIITPVTRMWKVQLELRGISYELGDNHTVYSLQFNQRFRLATNNALTLFATGKRLYDFNSYDINFKWNFYF